MCPSAPAPPRQLSRDGHSGVSEPSPHWGMPHLPGASSVPHLPEDEIEQQWVVDAVLGVENLPGHRPGLGVKPLIPVGPWDQPVPKCPHNLHLLPDEYFPGHVVVGVEILAAAPVQLGLDLLCLGRELP